jgi:predicted metal-dependent enzyme (double-stranded beta helix superfamily)
MRKGHPFADLRQATMFADELLLYLDQGRRFSLRIFIYEPGTFTPVHDHNAWGVIGSTFGKLSVVNYKRLDSGDNEGYARLAVAAENIYEPGRIEITRPADAGIHKTGNPASGMTIMVSVYGTPIRRLHINRFDVANDRVCKWYPPRIRKKMLITGALKQLMLEKRKRK